MIASPLPKGDGEIQINKAGTLSLPITRPGDSPPNPRHAWVPLLVLALILAGMAAPFLVARYHHSVIEKNQNAVIDALREYAVLQNQLFEKRGHYAAEFAELGGEWAKVSGIEAATPTEFSGYNFKKFTARGGADAKGGVNSFLDSQGRMSGGFALMAVPAHYGFTGCFTFFISSADGNKLYYYDMGVKTDTGARLIADYYIPRGARVFGEKPAPH